MAPPHIMMRPRGLIYVGQIDEKRQILPIVPIAMEAGGVVSRSGLFLPRSGKSPPDSLGRNRGSTPEKLRSRANQEVGIRQGQNVGAVEHGLQRIVGVNRTRIPWTPFSQRLR